MKKLAKRIWLLASLGPLLLIATLITSAFALASAFYPLAICAIVGLPLCGLYRRPGLMVAFGLLSATTVASLFLYPLTPLVHLLASAAAIGTSFLITHITTSELSKPFVHFRQQRKALKTELDDIRQSFDAYRRKIEQEGKVERVMLTELQALQSERNELLEDLYNLRRNKTSNPEQVEQARREANDAHAKLRQLREQFEEKQRTLHATRTQMWQHETTSLRLTAEIDTADPDDNYLASLIEESEMHQTEIERLEALVDSLLAELKGRSVPL